MFLNKLFVVAANILFKLNKRLKKNLLRNKFFKIKSFLLNNKYINFSNIF